MRQVSAALKSVKGVREVKVDFQSKVATVKGESTLVPFELLNALEGSGQYKGKILE